MSLFVAGTDTGVGKTLVSALLVARYARELELVYWKPVASGAATERDRTRVAELVPGAGTAAEAYLFADPVSPHLAARREGESIELERIGARWRELSSVFPGAGFVVEGAGGLLVPLNEDQDSADLMSEMGLPVILVVGMRLGCLNHALLTVDAMKWRGLKLAGWVANVVDADMAMLDENIAALRQRIEAPLLGIVPHQAQPDAREAAKSLDLSLLEQAEAHD